MSTDAGMPNGRGQRSMWRQKLAAGVGAVLLAFGTYVLGVMEGSTGDIGERADDCNTSLNDYQAGLGFARTKMAKLSDPGITPADLTTITLEIEQQWSRPHDEVLNICPLYKGSFVNWEIARTWADTSQQLASECFKGRSCSPDRVNELADASREATVALQNDVNRVDGWSLKDRIGYALQHLW
nr:hypothetical protein [Mycolicibacterium komanii]